MLGGPAMSRVAEAEGDGPRTAAGRRQQGDNLLRALMSGRRAWILLGAMEAVGRALNWESYH